MKIDCQYMRAEYSLFSEECAIKTAMNGNRRNGRNGSTFPFIISASSVFSVAMTTNRYHSLCKCGCEQPIQLLLIFAAVGSNNCQVQRVPVEQSPRNP